MIRIQGALTERCSWGGHFFNSYMTKESEIERKACEYAKSIGVLPIKLGKRKYPDRIFVYPGGRALFLEFKRHGEEPSPMQYARIEELRELGHMAHWVDNLEDAIGLLKHPPAPSDWGSIADS